MRISELCAWSLSVAFALLDKNNYCHFRKHPIRHSLVYFHELSVCICRSHSNRRCLQSPSTFTRTFPYSKIQNADRTKFAYSFPIPCAGRDHRPRFHPVVTMNGLSLPECIVVTGLCNTAVMSLNLFRVPLQNLVAVPLCPPQVLQEVPWVRTRVYWLRSQRLTAW